MPGLHGPHRLRAAAIADGGDGARLGAPGRARSVGADDAVGVQPVDGAAGGTAGSVPEGPRRVTPEARTSAALGEVETRLHDFVSRGAARATRHSPHYAELWHEMRAAVSGGKRVRPRLLLPCYTQLTNAAAAPDIQVAVAIELLATALRVPDDIIDGVAECRGAPNLVGAFRKAGRPAGLGEQQAARWGEAAGTPAGDLLLMSALRMGVLPDLD